MSSRSANVSVRVEPEIKEQAEKILAQVGVSASTFVNMAYRQVIMRNGIPFPVTIPQEPKTLEDMTEREFDEMMSARIEQVDDGNTIDAQEAFDSLLEDL